MIRTLIISGVVDTEHNYRVANDRIRQLLESTGKFDVKITEEFNGCTKETLKPYDLIVLNYDGRFDLKAKKYIRWAQETENAFFDFIESGKGLYLYHISVGLDGDNIPDIYKKVWGYYINFDEGSRRAPTDEYVVKVNKPVDPIMEGLPEQWFHTEDDFLTNLRKCPGTDPKVLLTAFDDLEWYLKGNYPPPHMDIIVPDNDVRKLEAINTDVPIAWTNTYGKGRIFACSAGHELETFRRQGYLSTVVRGCEWAATGQVTIAPPPRDGENRWNIYPFYDMKRGWRTDRVDF